jgi:hypothetical protein
MTERKSDVLLQESLGRAPFSDENEGKSFFGKGPTWLNDPQKIARQEAQQGLYLTASGTLTQFNAIVAAILATALASTDYRLLKISLAVALCFHLVASFLLCWAARPIESDHSASAASKNADDTFSNYRRGWRATLVGVLASSLAGVIFMLSAFGIDVATLLK